MTSTQFVRIQPYRSASHIHDSSSSSHHQHQHCSSSPHYHHRSTTTRARKFSLSSLTSPSPAAAISTVENTDALLSSSPSPTGAASSQESEDIEIIANGNPVSPGNTIPISYCSAMMNATEEEDSTDFGKRRISRTQSFDKTVFDIRMVPPEQIAAQITLLDLKVFRGISPKELRGCNWNKKEKHELAPNIVAFTQQFNHTAFLVMREILNEESEKVRAEIISQFIKIAKKLHELNNLHSLKAVISALQSMPIYRLSLTWRHLSKKDKSTFERLEELLSSDQNWKMLRDLMSAHRLPCIPDLGLYLTDLCFLQNVPNPSSRVESIINVVCYFQNSTYDGYDEEAHVQKYLTRARYIEELQKFYEDDNYKLSLKLEPQTPVTPSSFMMPFAMRSPIPPRSVPRPTPPAAEGKLRESRSCEEGLNEDEEFDDIESPYEITPRNSFTRRSLNTNSRGGISIAVATKQRLGVVTGPQLLYKSKRSAPINLGLGSKPLEEKIPGPVAGTKKMAACTGLPSSPPLSRLKAQVSVDRISDDVRQKEGTKLEFGTSAMSGTDVSPLDDSSSTTGTSISSHSSVFPPPPPKSVLGPPPSPLLAARKRGHMKSHSVGTNVYPKFGMTKISPPEGPKRYSPEPAAIAMSLIDDSLLSDHYPVTPTSSIGNGSSGGSSVEDVMVDLVKLSLEEEYHGSANLLRRGILRKKDVRHRGVTVSHFKYKSKIIFELYDDKISYVDLRGKKMGKQVINTMLRSCQLKHRDPRENLSEKQFLIIDDDGNSTKFTGSSLKEAMEWVVAIKEAMRVLEERDREEAERSLIKL